MSILGLKATRPRAADGTIPIRPDHQAEAALIRELWARQKASAAADVLDEEEQGYLDAHFAMPLTLRRRLAMIDWLAREIRPGDRVLEWGCRHGVDSCIYRRRFGSSLELHGCDYVEPEAYRPFHEYSGLQYQTVRHPYQLDYRDGFFDVVTSNGVWEHVLDEANSLPELFRVLRPGGLFLVACLPNRYSYTEALQRRLGHAAHDRLYTIGSASDQLRASGFEVLAWERRLLVPTMLNGFPRLVKSAYGKLHGAVWGLNGVLERVWPVNLIASNLMFVARRPRSADA
ncbi:class I SAM-dependent methyltransferase [Paludisphaera mucosa]|uniref:Methyltransferase domain-containing protein n=1 Tax=Paludisphaera mucosa TaxID=3030827 RepID=A0ABT6FFV2_9BACT|nr:methyltransferase domain-containing protein [Paludisphaera mucosa]MDG3006265.1 methyltransferase domain-containing protein [Paludisphaera mucosa]